MINENLERITNWANSSITSADPWLVYFGITNICNSGCHMCPLSSDSMRNDKGVMSFESFKNIFDQLPQSVKKIYMIKQGESFLNKELPKMIQYAREQRPNLHITLHSNIIRATKEKIKDVIPYMSSFGISISGIDKETYEKVHGKNKFEKVIQNLKDISDLVLSLPTDKRPHIFIDYVYQDRNVHENWDDVETFFRQFPGINSLDFHWLYNFHGETKEANFEAYDTLPQEQFPQCVFPWSAMVVLWDGKVDYCFTEAKENIFLGDFNTQTFEEIWNGEKYKNFRRRMAEKKFNELDDEGYGCAKCSWLWSPKIQSPKNLIGGYSLQQADDEVITSFGDVLELSEEEVLKNINTLIEQSQIFEAKGMVDYLLSTSNRKDILNSVQELNIMIINILEKYKNVHVWNNEAKKKSNKVSEYRKLQ